MLLLLIPFPFLPSYTELVHFAAQESLGKTFKELFKLDKEHIT